MKHRDIKSGHADPMKLLQECLRVAKSVTLNLDAEVRVNDLKNIIDSTLHVHIRSSRL